jgi:hypothetical protein
MAGFVLVCPGHPRLSLPPRAGKQDVDARATSAFTRVFDATKARLLASSTRYGAGMTEERLIKF